LIEFRGLSKSYGRFEAVHALDLGVSDGEVFGFLGPNGAGKTTTIRMMMGILVPSAGSVLIDGRDCRHERVEVQRRTGYLPDSPIFYDFLRGREILQFVAEMHGADRRQAAARAERALADFGLEEAREEFAVNYSLGMKKKLGLACALIHDPSVLVLDEPINGLDPRAARDVQDRVRDIAAQGRTIFLSTHLLDMAERLCTRVGIIHRGRLIAAGTPAAVKREIMGTDDATLEDAFLRATEGEGVQDPAGAGA
jgi:ABC-2 type transport system ATP-binding protein